MEKQEGTETKQKIWKEIKEPKVNKKFKKLGRNRELTKNLDKQEPKINKKIWKNRNEPKFNKKFRKVGREIKKKCKLTTIHGMILSNCQKVEYLKLSTDNFVQ